ncbi:hypothetical protein [Acetobacter senegalensis]|uniref:hypothetical protein n=1 Tax=Acetobacter senegalensis TaxID=446692 RepID=UPI001EDABC49|nr:hypothetical protein [Acetobacter senegalensis]MCG4258861.1 hypothetical protein [Acetobacter senegalensis]MCG4260788.1 hypothetical protein [Acetobacter senegalensis]MCG4268777.1 hypothetical protein [Acetobacter senegalensis]
MVNNIGYKVKKIGEIIDSSHESINIVKKMFSDGIYEKESKIIKMLWSTKEGFSASASIKKSTKEIHEISFSYDAASIIYKESSCLPFICKNKISIEGQNEIFKDILHKREECPALPPILDDEEIIDRIFRSTLAWIYLHEQAHLFQCHGEVENKLINKNSKYSIIEERELFLDQRFNSIHRHLFELSADYEATQYILPLLVGADKGELRRGTLWCLVFGLSCLFHRFYRYGGQVVEFKSEGTHPTPALRMFFVLQSLAEILKVEQYRKYIPWMQNPQNFSDLIAHATTTASMFRKVCYQNSFEEFPFLENSSNIDSVPDEYLDNLTKSWNIIRPQIESKYFGKSRSCILPLFEFRDLKKNL